MSIERVTLTHICVPLVERFRIRNGVVAEKDGILVTIAADGIAGIGEASPMSGSFHSVDTSASTWADLAGVLIPGLRAAGTEELPALAAVIEQGHNA